MIWDFESAQLTVPPDRQRLIQVGGKGIAFPRVFDLKFSGIKMTQIILKIYKVMHVAFYVLFEMTTDIGS